MVAAQQANQDNVVEGENVIPAWILDARRSIQRAYSLESRVLDARRRRKNEIWREKWCTK
jgi:hypothetical protein